MVYCEVRIVWVDVMWSSLHTVVTILKMKNEQDEVHILALIIQDYGIHLHCSCHALKLSNTYL